MRTVSEDIFITEKKPRKSTEKYPYEEMLDMKPHVLVRGEDFDSNIQAASVVVAIRKGFQKRGFWIRGMALNDDEVVIQVMGRE